MTKFSYCLGWNYENDNESSQGENKCPTSGTQFLKTRWACPYFLDNNLDTACHLLDVFQFPNLDSSPTSGQYPSCYFSGWPRWPRCSFLLWKKFEIIFHILGIQVEFNFEFRGGVGRLSRVLRPIVLESEYFSTLLTKWPGGRPKVIIYRGWYLLRKNKGNALRENFREALFLWSHWYFNCVL